MTTPRSRTGKLMQGLFGRFGQKPEVNSTPAKQPNRAEDDDEWTRAVVTDLDEEQTNWDDEETLDANNPIVYSPPIVPSEPLPPIASSPDLENWHEALPAATVANSPTQQTRRSKNQLTTSADDPWGDNLPNVKLPIDSSSAPQLSPPSQVERAIGFWAAILQQFRYILPPVRQLSDAILTVMLVAILTIGIWFVDGLFTAHPNPQVTTTKIAPIATAQIGPEQAFIEAIEAQLSDITTTYPDEIVRALQVDADRNLAIVQLNPVWYQIGDEQQDRITDRMWLQARANNFTKLELRDAEGDSIARNPVVGKHMIIFQRRQSS